MKKNKELETEIELLIEKYTKGEEVVTSYNILDEYSLYISNVCEEISDNFADNKICVGYSLYSHSIKNVEDVINELKEFIKYKDIHNKLDVMTRKIYEECKNFSIHFKKENK